ncbi:MULTISPECIES: ArnT family glycosyltransferase [Rhodobacterales]|uniref:ArnT family glycosyltransferase n=1 Tax=Rhodobacterales TaxID=204455 RepID=UPI0032985470
MSETRHNLVWGVICTGMILRLIWVLLVPVEPVSDSAAYDTFARNIWQHGVYGWKPDEPSAYWAVGTSALVAATYCVLGDTYWGVVGLNLLAAFVTMVLVWRIGVAQFGERAAFWATLLVAFWPNLIFFTSVLSSELYFIAMVLGGLYFWCRQTGNCWINLLICAVIWGLACYLRPVILLYPGALVIASLSHGLRATALVLVKGGVVIGLITLIASPWTMRNEAVIGKPYMISSNFGPNLWMGNNPDSTGGYMPLPAETQEMSEVEREEYLADLAKTYIREDIPRFIRGILGRVVTLHNRETIGVVWNEAQLENRVSSTGVLIAKALASGYWYALILTALAGIVVLLGRMRLGALFHPVFGSWAYFTAVHAIIVAEDRYHMPSSPFIALLAGVFFAAAIQAYQSNRRETE